MIKYGVWIVLFLFSGLSLASQYGRELCKTSDDYHCVRIKSKETWQKLWPDTRKRDIVMRANRMNASLSKGMIIAVPNNLEEIDLMDISPMPERIEPQGTSILFMDLSAHAFGAYDEYGTLLRWGPVSGGRGFCPDIKRKCSTPVGHFYVYVKRGSECVSSKYPIGEGGAPMPFCMFFHRGYALHASVLPGYHASHGCVRLFYEDAEWLNKNFVDMGSNGTAVIVEAFNRLQSPTQLALLDDHHKPILAVLDASPVCHADQLSTTCMSGLI